MAGIARTLGLVAGVALPTGTRCGRHRASGHPRRASPGPRAPMIVVASPQGTRGVLRRVPKLLQRGSPCIRGPSASIARPPLNHGGRHRTPGHLQPNWALRRVRCIHLNPRQTSACSALQRRVSPVSWAPAIDVAGPPLTCGATRPRWPASRDSWAPQHVSLGLRTPTAGWAHERLRPAARGHRAPSQGVTGLLGPAAGFTGPHAPMTGVAGFSGAPGGRLRAPRDPIRVWSSP